MTTTAAHWILLEGGGSRTWCGLAGPSGILATTTTTCTSSNPRSVGYARATDTLTRMLSELRDAAGGVEVTGILAAHGAASTVADAARFGDILQTAAAAIWGTARVLVCNDIAPLLLRGTTTAVCVVIAGTGTGFAARNGNRCSRASGLEWLLSDEGGGHDLAQAGLRAVVRALDHRGPDTALTDAARRWCLAAPDTPLRDALFDATYARTDDTKPHVATFAAHVVATAEAGDPVAMALVEEAVAELVTGAAAVCRSTGITEDTPLTLVLSGSMLTETDTLRRGLLTDLTQRLDIQDVIEHRDEHHPQALLALLDVWTRDPGRLDTLAAAVPAWSSPLSGSSDATP